jgi:hypothetical protein
MIQIGKYGEKQEHPFVTIVNRSVKCCLPPVLGEHLGDPSAGLRE